MKILAAGILFLIITSSSFAQEPSTQQVEESMKSTPTKEENSVKHGKTTKKRAEKNVKTNGQISTSGCETASGKTLAENDFGYADCIKQIGLKK